METRVETYLTATGTVLTTTKENLSGDFKQNFQHSSRNIIPQLRHLISLDFWESGVLEFLLGIFCIPLI